MLEGRRLKACEYPLMGDGTHFCLLMPGYATSFDSASASNMFLTEFYFIEILKIWQGEIFDDFQSFENLKFFEEDEKSRRGFSTLQPGLAAFFSSQHCFAYRQSRLRCFGDLRTILVAVSPARNSRRVSFEISSLPWIMNPVMALL